MALGVCAQTHVACKAGRRQGPGVATRPGMPGHAIVSSRPARSVAVAVATNRGRGGSQDDMDIHETKLGPNVLASVKDLKSGVKWGTATVVRNDAANLDGSVRVLHLSVADHVDMLYGRRVKGVPDGSRWIESYTIPGQCVGVRVPGGGEPEAAPPQRLYAIASTPYASRRDSAYVDASLIEIVVERTAGPADAALADMGPGAQLEVTQVIGRGFCSLLDSYNGLVHAMEEGRNLVLIGMGSRGMAALRSALNWQPVLAHASSGRSVAALYVAHSASRAAFVTEWDSWREAGMRLRPLYTNPNANVDDEAVVGNGHGSGSGEQQQQQQLDAGRAMDLLQVGLFMGEGGFDGICGGSASSACFMLAGLPGDMASSLAKQLSAKGVAYDHILFAQSDFF